MFKILSIEQLLSCNFSHKKSTYQFKKPIGKSLLFTALNPKPQSPKIDLRLNLEELFSSNEVGILQKEGNSTISVYDYFKDQYSNIKEKLDAIKDESDIKNLLTEINPFLSHDYLNNSSNLKLIKQGILDLLEEDWKEITRLQQCKDPHSKSQAEGSNFPSFEEMEKISFTLIDIPDELNKSQNKFTDILEKAYLRNKAIIQKEKDILPFLELLTVDFINNHMLVSAGDLGSNLHKPLCRLKVDNGKTSIYPTVKNVLSGSKAAFARIDQRDRSFILILVSAFGKVDGQMILVQLKIDIQKVIKNRRFQKNLMKYFQNPKFYCEISHGLSNFLNHRSYKIVNLPSIGQEIKKKIDNLLKSPDIPQNYKKLLPSLTKQEIHLFLTTLADKKKEKIKDIILTTILYYLTEIKDNESFRSDFGFIARIKSYADDAKETFDERDWEEVVSKVAVLMKSSRFDNKLFILLLESFFERSLFLTTYQDFSEIYTMGVSSEEEYLSRCLMIFDYRNWIKHNQVYKTLNQNTRGAIVNFLLRETLSRLEQPVNISEIKKISEITNKLTIDLTQTDLKPLITDIPGNIVKNGRLVGSVEEISTYFEVLKIFFQGLPHLTTYKNFSQICMVKERFSDDEYVNIALRIFDNDNWLNNETNPPELNGETKDIIKTFVMQQVVYLLPNAKEEISKNKSILNKLGITVTLKDTQPLINAIKSSPLMDNEKQEIKNGEGIQSFFEILSDFISDSKMLGFYTQYTGIKTGQYNYSDFNFVTTALKIMDHRNWQNGSLNQETHQAIKQLYFNTFLNQSLSQENKVSNLDILHNRLKIPITEQEKNELGKHVKDRIEGLVDLIDAMEKLVVKATRNMG